jgi:hypothetical protein
VLSTQRARFRDGSVGGQGQGGAAPGATASGAMAQSDTVLERFPEPVQNFRPIVKWQREVERGEAATCSVSALVPVMR